MLNQLNQTRDNSITAARHLLQLLKVRVTETTLADSVLTHPDYPSLLSISDSLQHWNMETAAIKATAEKLEALPVPFVVHLKTGGGKFMVVKKITPEEVVYLNEQGKEQSFAREDFLQRWDNVVLLAEAGEASGEADYKKNQRKELWGVLFVPITLTLLLLLGIAQAGKLMANTSAGAIYYTAFLLFSFLGMLATGLLLWHEYDGDNPLLQKVCSAGKKSNTRGGRTGCETVLNSSASKIIGTITWSEIGFIYFTGGYLYLLIAGISSLPFVMALNILALPYIIFSIYYQAKVARQWCVLCLSVQSLLLLEFLAALYTGYLTSQPFDRITFQPVIFLLSFLIPTFAWFFAKPSLYAARKGTHLRYQLARFKNNGEVFGAMLRHQPAMARGPAALGIRIGNPQAPNVLTKVCNPYCGPCAQAHPKIEALISESPDWQAQIIFTATGEDKDRRTAPAAHLLAIAGQKNEAKTRQALDEWYDAEEKDYERFAAKYPMNRELNLQKETLKAMDNWCKEAGITHTPTFFVNGYRLPDAYNDIADLKYITSAPIEAGPA